MATRVTALRHSAFGVGTLSGNMVLLTAPTCTCTNYTPLVNDPRFPKGGLRVLGAGRGTVEEADLPGVMLARPMWDRGPVFRRWRHTASGYMLMTRFVIG